MSNLEHLPLHSHQPSPSSSTQNKDPTTVLFWIFQEFCLGKLFSCEEGVVWQTRLWHCFLSVSHGAGCLGSLCFCMARRNPSTHSGWCLYTILDAWGLFEESFAEKTGACVCVDVGLDILCICGTWGPDLTGLAVLGSDGPNDIKGLFQPM